MGTKANVLVGTATLKVAEVGGSVADVGYTQDGVEIEYGAKTEDIRVDQETFAIDRVITEETVSVKCNLAEATLAHLKLAIAGMDSGGGIGGGVQKYLTIELVGKSPAGTARTITITKGTAIGPVGIPYKVGKAQVVPFSFEALAPGGGADAVTVTDAS